MAVRAPSAGAEELRARMLELFPEGFEEIERSGMLEAAAYTDDAGVARARAAFGELEIALVSEDWADRWREFHRPVRVGPLWVGPPWLAADVGGPQSVVIDPGRAFGTGAHPTTRLCLELLLDCPRASLLDAGCGSGVVAIAAAKLGFGPVVAVDHDGASLDAARRNATANAVELEVREADVLTEALPPAQICVANIALGPVEALARRRHAPLLVTSGYFEAEEPRATSYRRHERRTLQSWAADLFVLRRE